LIVVWAEAHTYQPEGRTPEEEFFRTLCGEIEILRDEQKVERRFCAGNVSGPSSERNPAVLGKQKIVAEVAVTAEPKMFDLNLRPVPERCTDHPTVAEITKFFLAFRIHTLGDHVEAPLDLLR
jgi:hypothetical protein